MTEHADALFRFLGKERVKRDELLAPHTYMKVGGPAELFFIARSAEDLKLAVGSAIRFRVPYFILGGGSNIIVGDGGIRGLVIKNRAAGIVIDTFKGKVTGRQVQLEEARVVAESGVITNLLVRRTIDAGLTGLEYFLGVPGTIGGAIYNNSHFKTELIGNFVESVVVIDGNGNEKKYKRTEMRFAYDFSILQQTQEVVVRVTFRLRGGDSGEIWKKAESYAKYRTGTQPLNFPSSGCIFKNVGAGSASYGPEKSGLQSAGYLIDQAGLKGTRIGSAQVSEKHASFIVNTGGATAKDIMTLVSLVRDRVKEKFAVTLEMEVFPVGEFEV